MFKKIFFTVFVIALVSIFCNRVYAEIEFPEPVGYVNDFENILNNDEELESKLSDFQQQTSSEIAVVTVKDFQGLTIEEYATELFEKWGIGTNKNDNGVLILVSAEMRESRIEVGYGLEAVLTDSMTGRIQDNEMIPYFQSGDYSQGINNGIDAVISSTKGEYINTDPQYEGNNFDEILSTVMLIFVIIIFFSMIFGRNRGFFSTTSGIMRAVSLGSSIASGISRSSGYRNNSSSSFKPSSSSFRGFSGGRSGGGGSSRKW